ncbi:ABC transporter ATP-binding protein [Halobacillus locisalis]|uniref:ABC transporter ATP-binding protein n=1 Tax=Halobacillus locisalis TaxID=220753 RepID=A0A838CUV8_9BACI|nr:ABC transporter ATP-binding protein [Halobacillus locisalis]MBA2175857.1 ABC transporter ATP-binding protein [Halobacillus locisalis]
MSSISTKELKIGYGDVTVVDDLNLHLPKGKVTTIIGPNGCGKSTVLQTMSRLIQPKKGSVYLDGKAIHKASTKEIAKKMAVLPQTPDAPTGLTVYELVSYGRFPHQRGFGRLTEEDRDIVEWALEVTAVQEFADRSIDALSGGQRQKVWIAMALAQETELLLLDEPTTYLDLAHQLEVLQLLDRLNREENRTIAMVLHDLNHAARFADFMVAIKDGQVVKEGDVERVMTEDVLKEVFQIDAQLARDPRTGRPALLTYDLLSNSREKTEVLV